MNHFYMKPMKILNLLIFIFCLPILLFAQTKSVSINPNTGMRNQSLAVVITGVNTHFISGTNTVTFFRGASSTSELSLTNKSILNDTLMGGIIQVNANATYAAYSFKVYNGTDGYVFSSNYFYVSSNGSSPSLSSLTPNNGEQGGNLLVAITGLNTHFTQASYTNQVNFIRQGTATTSIVSFVDPPVASNLLTSRILISTNAPLGNYDLQVINQVDGSLILPNVFTVTAGNGPKILSITPPVGHLRETLNVTILGSRTNFTQSSQTLLFFRQGTSSVNINVNSLTPNNDSMLTANISIPNWANRGFYSFMLYKNKDTTGQSALFLAEVFEVDFAIGISEQVATEEPLIVYPNPAQKQITVSANKRIEQVDLFDLQGRLLQTTKPSLPETEIEIKVDDFILPKQCYFLKIKTVDGIVVRKLMLE